ncbi:amidohydrolase family protein [Rhodococcus sp. I2R]|uniref:amidohydrolase family protein n=1 Tax=Rhodococcus sp. I2R TaxID=2855445 RepID=UPI001E375E7D|nr:amidohydrolase family protein [Rhodococcus sp. I2R]MCC8930218.1 amidohydrolase [Rhodococcus sp. I2R]
MNAPIVDVHAHAIVPEIEAAVAGRAGLDAHRALDARRNGAESLQVSGKMVAARISQLIGVDRRLADMDAAGIDIQVVSPSPSHYHYWADRELAQVVTSSANRGIAALVAEEPSRLVGLGLIALQHPEDVVAALDDAVITCGLAGVEISSFAPGVELSDARLEPFWARASELGAVVFLHPFGCSLDERLDRFYLSNTVGQPVENAVALSHIIFAGVLDRHPTLRVLAAHGGGYLPTYIGRSDHAWEVRPEARRCTDRPSSYLPRITFDSLVHGAGALRALVDAVGTESVVLGSDYPFDMGTTDPVSQVRAAGLTEAATRSILGDNAFRLGLSTASSGVQS